MGDYGKESKSLSVIVSLPYVRFGVHQAGFHHDLIDGAVLFLGEKM